MLFYVALNSQGHIATGSLQVEETSAHCIVNHQASPSNYQHEAPSPRFELGASEVGGETFSFTAFMKVAISLEMMVIDDQLIYCTTYNMDNHVQCLKDQF